MVRYQIASEAASRPASRDDPPRSPIPRDRSTRSAKRIAGQRCTRRAVTDRCRGSIWSRVSGRSARRLPCRSFTSEDRLPLHEGMIVPETDLCSNNLSSSGARRSNGVNQAIGWNDDMIACDLLQTCDREHPHRSPQFRQKNFKCAVSTMFAFCRGAIKGGTTNSNGMCSQPQAFDDIATATNSSIDNDGRAFADFIRDGGQHINRGRGGIAGDASVI